MATKDKLNPIKEIQDDFKFLRIDGTVDVVIADITTKVYPGWYVALDNNGDIHMFSQRPDYDERLKRWVPKRPTCIAILIDRTFVYGDNIPTVVYVEKNDSYRHSLTDRELRFLTLKGAVLGTKFTVNSITEWAANKAVKEEAARRNCNFRLVKSSSRFSHTFILWS